MLAPARLLQIYSIALEANSKNNICVFEACIQLMSTVLHCKSHIIYNLWRILSPMKNDTFKNIFASAAGANATFADIGSEFSKKYAA